MAVHIPDGFGFVAGRSREKAQELLALADASDLDRKVAVRTTEGGYLVDERLLDFGGEEIDLGDNAPAGEVHEVAGTVESTSGDNTPVGATSDNPDGPADDQNSGPEDGPVESVELVPPAKNASQEVWANFAKEHHGYNPEEGLGRNELIERYGA